MYWSLGNTPFAREIAYADMVRSGLTTQQQDAIVGATLHGWALGEAAFVQELQKQTDRRVSKAKPGRPTLKSPLGEG
ncbi:hypothetical protein D3C86_2187180 [compost metagenome]